MLTKEEKIYWTKRMMAKGVPLPETEEDWEAAIYLLEKEEIEEDWL